MSKIEEFLPLADKLLTEMKQETRKFCLTYIAASLRAAEDNLKNPRSPITEYEQFLQGELLRINNGRV